MDIQNNPLPRSKIGNAINNLVPVRDSLINTRNRMEQKKDLINSQNRPLPQSHVNRVYDEAEANRSAVNNALRELRRFEPVANHIKELLEHEIPDKFDLFIKTLNNVHLSYGLEGRLKRHIRDTNPPMVGIPSEARDIITSPYRRVPHTEREEWNYDIANQERRGGRRRRKGTKKMRTRL